MTTYLNFDEFQKAINYSVITGEDLKIDCLKLLVKFAKDGKFEYFRFLFNHPKQILDESVIVSHNYY